MPGGRSDEPLDLGAIPVTAAKKPEPASSARIREGTPVALQYESELITSPPATVPSAAPDHAVDACS